MEAKTVSRTSTYVLSKTQPQMTSFSHLGPTQKNSQNWKIPNSHWGHYEKNVLLWQWYRLRLPPWRLEYKGREIESRQGIGW
jgi:hypothetical protein